MMTTDADIWSAHVNPANGLTYYYNSVSQESTYVAPPHLQKKPAEAALASSTPAADSGRIIFQDSGRSNKLLFRWTRSRLF